MLGDENLEPLKHQKTAAHSQKWDIDQFKVKSGLNIFPLIGNVKHILIVTANARSRRAQPQRGGSALRSFAADHKSGCK